MSNKSDENIADYIQPILKSRRGYDLLESYKYQINMPDPSNKHGIDVDVVNVNDVLGIVMTVQIESTLLFIEKLLKDDNIVMTTEMQESFDNYADDIRRVMEKFDNGEE